MQLPAHLAPGIVLLHDRFMGNLKPAILGLLTFLASASPALADKCAEELQKIEKALSSRDLSPDIRAQLEDMKHQAEQLCAAGHRQEGLDVTSEAKALLNID
jgi:hypothetical protein